MSNLVIVAIPEKEDIVWKVSSEKVPHMTLLHLGEQEPSVQTAKILTYLEHAADTMLRRFRMAVDHRGDLGPKKADVLFFDKDHCEAQVNEFREALLKNPDVLELYNGSEQFPEWVPHLTLGFPETPANPDTRDYANIYGVGFGKIALWVDDYDGPEIELTSRDDHDLLMSELGDELKVTLDQTVSGTDIVQAQAPYDPAERRERYLRERQLIGRKSAGAVLNRPAPGTANEGTAPTPAQQMAAKEKVWGTKANQENLRSRNFIACAGKLDKLTKNLVKKYGMKETKDLEKNPAALKEWIDGTVGIMNTQASKTGISPSKTRRIEYYYDPADQTLKNRIVPNTASHAVEENDSDLFLDQTLSETDLLQFDESKVKRGKGGKFASKAESSGDADWMSPENLRNLHMKILQASGKEIIAAKQLILKNHGLSPTESVANHPQAQRQLLTATVAILNKAAKTQGVSPSGNARVNFAVNKEGTGIYKSAVLNNDTHRVGGRQVVPSAKHSDDSGISLDQKVQDIDALQFGRVGMKWGVVHPRGADGRVQISGRSTRKTRRALRKSGIHKLSDEDLKKLTDRINLENNYKSAVSNSSRTAAFNTKAKRAIDLGKNANDAAKFAASPIGQELLKRISPSLAANAKALYPDKGDKKDKSGGVVDAVKAASGKKGDKHPLTKIAKGISPAVTGKHVDEGIRKQRVADRMRGKF